MSRWEVEQLDTGLVDVRRDGRSFAYDEDLEDALATITREDGRGTTYTLIEPDGYRTSLATA